ncbi:hypothetical protein C7974DRAFT_386093 [Boeremia exigua]|uniref:uncharacterized protein n=1 Tax=Boeremia exigua TaxID=749465 RepID=UPI001E8CE4D4|nr:uncharacterized protein C7974DRAFT_386093 [Boeremia exigua]KAH6642764.1 hypothetical protein C7974DRAFT_386093 [Boeremia exigua]
MSASLCLSSLSPWLWFSIPLFDIHPDMFGCLHASPKVLKFWKETLCLRLNMCLRCFCLAHSLRSKPTDGRYHVCGLLSRDRTQIDDVCGAPACCTLCIPKELTHCLCLRLSL